jgi:hypothetical protein
MGGAGSRNGNNETLEERTIFALAAAVFLYLLLAAARGWLDERYVEHSIRRRHALGCVGRRPASGSLLRWVSPILSVESNRIGQHIFVNLRIAICDFSFVIFTLSHFRIFALFIDLISKLFHSFYLNTLSPSSSLMGYVFLFIFVLSSVCRVVQALLQ